MAKTRSQKSVDLQDAHDILRIFYDHNLNQWPAGVSGGGRLLKGVPSWHRRMADRLVAELRARQLIKTALSQETLATWKLLVKQYTTWNLFTWVDRLRLVLDTMPKANESHLNASPWHEILKQDPLVLKNGKRVPNDRIKHHWIETSDCQGIQCYLTGERLTREDFA